MIEKSVRLLSHRRRYCTLLFHRASDTNTIRLTLQLTSNKTKCIIQTVRCSPIEISFQFRFTSLQRKLTVDQPKRERERERINSSMYISFQFHLVTQTRRLDKRLDASVNGYVSKEHEGIIKRPFLSRVT